MASNSVSDLQTSCQHTCRKCCSRSAANTSLDSSTLSIGVGETNAYENTPSPSSVCSTSAIEQSPKCRQQILSSTLKSDHSLKRCSRYNKLLHQSNIISRQYMIAMTNVLFQMQKELYRLKRRTHRVEHYMTKQQKLIQPIIRIPRLTQDQLSTICIDDTETTIQNTNISADKDQQNVADETEPKTAKPIKSHKSILKRPKNSMKRSKKQTTTIWINNRQKPIDPNKYCSLCKREYSKRSNYLLHVRSVHHGELPEQNHSSTEFSEKENNDDDAEKESTNDESGILLGLTAQSDNNDNQPCRGSADNSSLLSPTHPRVKCDICNKFYRADYIKRHKQRAHDEQLRKKSDSLAPTCDITTEKENSTVIEGLHDKCANTPMTVAIADMDADDEPIRFSNEQSRTIILAVTCLEPYQLKLVEEFLEKFSSQVCQTTSIDSRTTHLITNDEQHQLRSPLSMKLIEAIAHHCYCVSYRWILDCLKYDRIITETSYEIEGDNTDTTPHGGPRRSRTVTSRHSLFQNVCFMIKCTENADMHMTNDRLESLIMTCGGQIITCVTHRLLDKYQIVVLCDKEYVSERRHNYEQCRSLGIQFVSSDWVLESILEYRLKPFLLFEEVPL